MDDKAKRRKTREAAGYLDLLDQQKEMGIEPSEVLKQRLTETLQSFGKLDPEVERIIDEVWGTQGDNK